MTMQLNALGIRTAQRILLAFALVLTGMVLAPRAAAQGGGGMMNMSPDERAAQRITVLTERVQIDAQQVERLKPILVKQFTDQTAIFQKFQGGGDRAAMMGEMQALRTKYDAEITAVLTDEQKPRYAALLEEEAARRANRGGGGGGQ